MPAYFDSSVLLSLLVGDALAGRAQKLWQAETERVSSILLDVECTIVLRRALTAGVTVADQRAAEQRLDLALDEVTLKPVDETIAEIAHDTPALAGCRALDAVHLATALYFRAADPELRVCTFDARMSEVARRLGFLVCDQQSETA